MAPFLSLAASRCSRSRCALDGVLCRTATLRCRTWLTYFPVAFPLLPRSVASRHWVCAFLLMVCYMVSSALFSLGPSRRRCVEHASLPPRPPNPAPARLCSSSYTGVVPWSSSSLGASGMGSSVRDDSPHVAVVGPDLASDFYCSG